MAVHTFKMLSAKQNNFLLLPCLVVAIHLEALFFEQILSQFIYPPMMNLCGIYVMQ